MNVYGLRHKTTGKWLMGTHGLIFSTPAIGAAEAQRDQFISLDPADWEVAQFQSAAWAKTIAQWKAEGRCPRCGSGPMPITGAEDCMVAAAECPIDPTTGRLYEEKP